MSARMTLWLALAAHAASGVVFLCSAADPVAMPRWLEAASIDRGDTAFPEAEVVLLLDEREVRLDATGKRRIRTHRVFHVRKGDAREEVTPVVIENYWKSVRSFRAWHRDANGIVSEVAKPVITQVGSELYTDARQYMLPIANTGPGSIVALEIEEEDRRTEDSFLLEYLPETPILEWRFRLLCPEKMIAHAHWSEESTSLTPAFPDSDLPGEWSWSRAEIDTSDLVFVAEVQDPAGRACSLRDWPEVSTWFGGLMREAIVNSPELVAAAKPLRQPSTEATIEEVAKFVQESISYVQIYLEDGGWRPHRASDVLQNRYGDCKDKAGLMIGLLDAAGVPARPVLTCTAGPFLPGVPARGQFDHCIVALPGADGGTFRFFDPTSPSVPLGRLPASVEGKWALVVAPGADAEPITLPRSEVADNCLAIKAAFALDTARMLHGVVEERRTGHLAFPLRHWLNQENESLRAQKLAESREENGAGLTASDLQLAGLEPDADTLFVRWTLVQTEAGRAAGPRVLLHPDPWRRETSYFGKEIGREELSFPYRIERSIEIAIPEGWSIEEVPENVAFSNEVGEVQREIDSTTGALLYRRVEVNRVTSTPPALEAALREWDRAGYRADQQAVVLRKP